jgi:protein-tyrosine phosphatase
MPSMPTASRTPYRVCFVCSGNICRSPMAEAVFRARVLQAGLDGLVEPDSGGTGDWWEGSGADHRAVAVLAGRGYGDCGERHIARQFKPGWFAERDLVIALDSGHLRRLRALASTPQDAAKVRLLLSYSQAPALPPTTGETPVAPHQDDEGADLDVPDPYYGGPKEFEHCLALIEPAVDALLEAVRAEIAKPREAAHDR